MPGCVNNVDVPVVPANRRILGEDGDATLTFEITGVHDTIRNVCARAQRTGLPQQLVHECGLAVINVRDDRDIANFVCREHGRSTAKSRALYRVFRRGSGLQGGKNDLTARNRGKYTRIVDGFCRNSSQVTVQQHEIGEHTGPDHALAVLLE